MTPWLTPEILCICQLQTILLLIMHFHPTEKLTFIIPPVDAPMVVLSLTSLVRSFVNPISHASCMYSVFYTEPPLLLFSHFFKTYINIYCNFWPFKNVNRWTRNESLLRSKVARKFLKYVILNINISTFPTKNISTYIRDNNIFIFYNFYWIIIWLVGHILLPFHKV